MCRQPGSLAALAVLVWSGCVSKTFADSSLNTAIAEAFGEERVPARLMNEWIMQYGCMLLCVGGGCRDCGIELSIYLLMLGFQG